MRNNFAGSVKFERLRSPCEQRPLLPVMAAGSRKEQTRWRVLALVPIYVCFFIGTLLNANRLRSLLTASTNRLLLRLAIRVDHPLLRPAIRAHRPQLQLVKKRTEAHAASPILQVVHLLRQAPVFAHPDPEGPRSELALLRGSRMFLHGVYCDVCTTERMQERSKVHRRLRHRLRHQLRCCSGHPATIYLDRKEL